MDTTKIDAMLAWMAGKAEHIGDGLKSVGIGLVASVTFCPSLAKYGGICYIVGMVIGKFIKPDDSKPEPLPPVKDIKGNVRIGLLLAVTALTLLTGCATVRGWFNSTQAHDIERTVRVDAKDIATIAIKDGKSIITTLLVDAQEFSTNTTEQAAVAKTIVEIAPLLVK